MQTKLRVEGVTCSHCENTVIKALSAINGVTNVSVDLIEKMVTVIHDENTNEESLKNEIEEQGYNVVK